MSVPRIESRAATSSLFFMRRRFPLRLRLAGKMVGAVPMADVVLLMLIFIIMNTWIVLRPGVALQLPEAAPLDGVRMNATVVMITRDGMIFFNDTRISVDHLAERFADALRRAPASSLLIEADREVSHEVLLLVYKMAQNAGYSAVYLATQFGDVYEASTP